MTLTAEKAYLHGGQKTAAGIYRDRHAILLQVDQRIVEPDKALMIFHQPPSSHLPDCRDSRPSLAAAVCGGRLLDDEKVAQKP
jgi:hypothetical protein